jgi:hypothetical protein
MLGVVETVSWTVFELTPSSVTLVGLKVQSAPAGKPAVQLPGVVPVEELAEFVKLIVSVEPFWGAMVRTATADCPAGTELGARLLVTVRVKSVTVTEAGEGEVEGLSEVSPS